MGASHRGPYRPHLLPGVPLVRAVGRILGANLEEHDNPDEVDHVLIRMDMGGEIVVAVNTLSKRNRLAGFDSRVRVGMVKGTWDVLPVPGAEVCGRMDYADIESRDNVFYEHMERNGLEDLLMDCCARACLLEVWGAPYHQRRQGIHQIHSRRASCAVAEDITGRDGALKFYFEEGHATLMLLFKFCGQP